jgi:mannose-6-phosphate isomerase-like protein (cupin superfamily)
MDKRSKDNSEHYFWGSGCEGWRFLNSEDLCVTREMIPPGKSEKKHFHSETQQFFYIIHGSAVFYMAGKEVKVNSDEGMHILPGTIHSISNTGDENLEFIVISDFPTQKDRINTD